MGTNSLRKTEVVDENQVLIRTGRQICINSRMGTRNDEMREKYHTGLQDR